MALKAVVGSLDGLPEAVQGEYTKGEDGRYYLAVEGVDDMPAVQGLRTKYREILDEKKQLAARFEALGVSSPEEIETLRAAAKQNNSEKVKELEGKLSQASEAAQKEILRAQQEAEAERTAARAYFEDGEITRAISGAKGVPELLSHVVRQHIKTERGEDGRFSLRVLGRDGQPRIKDSAGNAFGLDDLVAELKSDPKYGRAFEASEVARAGGGSGAPANNGGSGGSGARGTFDRNDPMAWSANLEGIVKGEVTAG